MQIDVLRHARFWSKVAIGGEDECWLWVGAHNGLGYGRFKLGDRFWYAHRFVHHLAYGHLPRVVMHACDTPACVNPRHLKGGTQRDNVMDMLVKGRGVPPIPAIRFGEESSTGCKYANSLVEQVKSFSGSHAQAAKFYDIPYMTAYYWRTNRIRRGDG